MRDLIQELLETHEELGQSIHELDQDEKPSIQREPEQISLDEAARAKANAILRRLETMRWISVETRSQFDRYLVLPHYSSKLIGLFKELCEAKSVEYQRFAFLIYQSLTGEAAKLQPCSAVLSAADVSARQELIALYNNMKAHMEQVVRKTSIQDVLDHHFEQYKSQIIDKSYHRLKPSDHVARYRMQIINTVQQWLLDSAIMEEAALDGVKSGLYAVLEEAERAARQALFFIEETFLGLDDEVRVSYHEKQQLNRDSACRETSTAILFDFGSRSGGFFSQEFIIRIRAVCALASVATAA
jgi:hypothetical protein